MVGQVFGGQGRGRDGEGSEEEEEAREPVKSEEDLRRRRVLEY